MTVKIIKGDPLAGINNRAQVAAKIGIFVDESASYQERKNAAGWLRGAWMVMRKHSNNQTAVKYIDGLLKERKYAEDTSSDE